MKRDSPTSAEEERRDDKRAKKHYYGNKETIAKPIAKHEFRRYLSFAYIHICVNRIRSESKITDILFDETCAIARTHTHIRAHTRGTSERHTHAKLTHSWCHPEEYIRVYGYVLRIRFSILLSLFNFIFIWPTSKNTKRRRWCFKHLRATVELQKPWWQLANRRRGRKRETGWRLDDTDFNGDKFCCYAFFVFASKSIKENLR